MEEKQDSKKPARVEVVENGPLRITGNFVLKDLKRNREETLCTIDLCRCGRTNNKPYCDNTCGKQH